LLKRKDIQGGLIWKRQSDLVNPEHYLVFRFLTELNTLVLNACWLVEKLRYTPKFFMRAQILIVLFWSLKHSIQKKFEFV